MNLVEFRATRQDMPIAEAISKLPFMADMDLSSDYTGASVYAGGTFILHSRRGAYLEIEGDEYESRDTRVLEFVLWQWSQDDSDSDLVALRALIWG